MTTLLVGGDPYPIESINWDIHSPEECCKDEPGGDFGYWFCMAICVLCCSTLEITFKKPKIAKGHTVKNTTEERDYPTTHVFNGLSFTTSSYGLVIPIVFGSDKLTGNVFWASKVRTITTTLNGEDFVYQQLDFALGLCEGEINGLLRMWLGPKLVLDNTANVDDDDVAVPNEDGFINGFTVDFTDEDSPLRGLTDTARQTKVSVFNGSETQMPEGVMVSQEGYDNTPAYRGLAYVLFENFVVAESNIPALFAEITSHTASQFPRVYGSLATSTFDTQRFDMLQYDSSYDRFIVTASKPSLGKKGLVIFDGNDLSEKRQLEFELANTIAPDWQTTGVLQINGFLSTFQQASNNGYLYILNPFTGALLDSLGPGGSISAHSLSTGFSALYPPSVVTFTCPGTRGLPIDVFGGVGIDNKSVGFAEIDETGEIRMASVLNNVLSARNNAAAVFAVDDPTADAKPTFIDGAATSGTHMYGFGFRNSEDTSIAIWRVTVEGAGASLAAPVYTSVGTLSVDLFGGTGFSYSVARVMVDTADYGLILLITGRETRLVKYNPFTGAIVWNTPVSDFPTSVQSTQGPDWSMTPGGKYVWIDAAQHLWQITLDTGTVTQILGSMGAQSLPSLSNAHQFYNGYENSITYLSADTEKYIVKVLLDRVTRSTIDLSDIVTNLVGRTGLLPTDMDVQDLSALTLNGYTVNQIKSLRQCFSELSQAFTYDVIESNGKVKYKTRGAGVDFTIPHKWLAAGNDEDWLQINQQNDGARVRKINLTYRDIDREYESNVQSIILAKSGVQSFDPEAAIDVNVPIVLTAEDAKKLGEILLYAKLTYNTTYEFSVAPRYLTADPADVVTIEMPDGEDDITMRLRTVAVGSDNVVSVQASEENSEIYTDQIDLFGNIGRYEKSQMRRMPRRVDPFVLQMAGRSFDEIGDTISKYKFYVAFLASDPDITLTDNVSLFINGEPAAVIHAPSSYPTWGYVVTPPTLTRSLFSLDEVSELVVELVTTTGAEIGSELTPGDVLEFDTVNLCYIGGELLQFTTATDLGGGKWKLTGLMRAKFGSDIFANTARSGDRFILLAGNDGVLDELGIVALDIDVDTSPRKVAQFFMNTGNPFMPPYISVYTAMNLRPVVTSDLQLHYSGTDAVMTWERRSRLDGQWPDDGSIPPSEEVSLPELAESYSFYLYKDPATFRMFEPSTYMRKVDVTSPTFTYTAAMQTEDGFVRATETLFMMLYQTGSQTGIDDGAGEVGRLFPPSV